MKISEKYLWTILGLIIFSRILLIQFPSFKIDMSSWQAWTARLSEQGPTKFYAPDYFADYLPGYLYILWIMGKVFKSSFPNSDFFSLDFEYYLKFITNLFDFATALFIYKIVYRYQKHLALPASILYLLNPALIFNSSIWGQVDGVLTFFLVFSLYQLLEKEQSIKWGISSAISLIVKPQTFAILPVMLTEFIKRTKTKEFVLALTLLSLLPILISIPFFLNNPILGIFQLVLKTAEGYPYTSLYAFNLWSIIGWWQQDNINWIGLPYKAWGTILFALSLVLIVYPLTKNHHEKSNYFVYLASALSFFAFFLFPTRVHERYLFPFFAFLVIAICLSNNFKFFLIYVFLSIIHFLNLWYVYYYYNIIYNNPNIQSNALYIFIDHSYKWFAGFTLILFFIMIYIYYKEAKIIKTKHD